MADPAVATQAVPPQAPPKADPAPVVAAPAVVAASVKEPVAPAAEVKPVAEVKPTLLGDVKEPAKDAAKVEPAKADYSKLALPKDSLLDPKAVDALKTQAEKLGLSADAAQEFVNAQSGSVKAYHDGLLTGHQAQVGKWKGEVESHPTLGGGNLKATNEAVTQVLERFAPKGLMEQLQQAGYNWHPGLVELLSNVHAATKDDSFVRGGSGAAQPASGGLEDMYKPKK